MARRSHRERIPVKRYLPVGTKQSPIKAIPAGLWPVISVALTAYLTGTDTMGLWGTLGAVAAGLVGFLATYQAENTVVPDEKGRRGVPRRSETGAGELNLFVQVLLVILAIVVVIWLIDLFVGRI